MFKFLRRRRNHPPNLTINITIYSVDQGKEQDVKEILESQVRQVLRNYQERGREEMLSRNRRDVMVQNLIRRLGERG
jgi:hypothetical protein